MNRVRLRVVIEQSFRYQSYRSTTFSGVYLSHRRVSIPYLRMDTHCLRIVNEQPIRYQSYGSTIFSGVYHRRTKSISLIYEWAEFVYESFDNLFSQRPTFDICRLVILFKDTQSAFMNGGLYQQMQN